MKISVKIVVIFLLTVLASCNKEDDFDYPQDTVGHSRVTYFPVLTMAGSTVMSIVKGATFTDPGVKATEGGATITVTVTGTVNTATVGLYELTYSATNKDGFPATVTRIVIVIPEEEKPGVDLSGEYLPIGGAPANASITKMDKGIYYTTNCWGGGSLAVIPAYFISTDGATVTLPLQNSPAGRIVTAAPGTYLNGTISWTVSRLDFAGGPLIVAKQWKKL